MGFQVSGIGCRVSGLVRQRKGALINPVRQPKGPRFRTEGFECTFTLSFHCQLKTAD